MGIDRKTIQIHTRTVRYGCPLEPRAGYYDRNHEDAGEYLYRNEIAVDVGGSCWGYNTPQEILDHHFDRPEGNYPSAAAAALHLHHLVEGWVESLPKDTPYVQIVMHQDPDFDALAAAQIVEELIREPLVDLPREALGLHEKGWLPTGEGEKRRRINWFEPERLYLAGPRAWLFQVASVAALNDQCHGYATPIHLRLPAVLEAGIKRGRFMKGDAERRAFFAAVREEIQAGANPLTDAVLEANEEYRREFAILRGVPEAYERDLRQARIVSIPVPVTPDFRARYAGLQEIPFLREGGREMDERHLLHDRGYEPVDGLYLRDPECLLFKTLARQDRRNSPSKRGFVFTAIAYSNRKQNSVNHSDYYFSLDPEAIPNAHLYPAWALLEEAEIRARQAAGTALDDAVRKEFKDRAKNGEGHFLDPWFDGGSYLATIVVTPGSGTLIGPAGKEKDLLDDPVVRIVREHLETLAFSSDVCVWDLTQDGTVQAPGDPARYPVSGNPPTVPEGHFRCVHVELRDGVTLDKGMGESIAREMWQWLTGERVDSMPENWKSHCWQNEGAAGVWGRQGIALATTPGARRFHDETLQCVHAMAEISGGIRNPRLDREKLPKLLMSAARERWEAKQDVCRLGAHFLESMQFDQQIELLYDQQSSRALGNSLQSIRDVQTHAAQLEVFIFAIYLVELAHVLSEGTHEVMPIATGAYFVLALICGVASFVPVIRKRHEAEERRRREEKGEEIVDAPEEHGGVVMHLLPQIACLVGVVAGGFWLSHAAHERVAAKEEARAAVEKQEKTKLEEERRVVLERLAAIERKLTPPAAAQGVPKKGRKRTD